MKNLVFTINSKYVEKLLITLNSIFINNPNEEFNIYVLNSSLRSQELQRIEEYITKRNSIFYSIVVDNNIFNEGPILRKDFSKEAYYKLLIPVLLPKEIDRVLYMDVDIVVDGNLDELYNIGLDDKFFAACPDYFVNSREFEYKKRLGMEENDRYFNSGVILFNLSTLRNEYNLNKKITYILENGKNFKFHDQEVFNAFYFKNYVWIPEKYNYLTRYKNIKDFFIYRIKDKNIIMYHYAGTKPWNYDYFGKYMKKYWKYVDNENCSIDKKEFFRNYKITKIIINKIKSKNRRKKIK